MNLTIEHGQYQKHMHLLLNRDLWIVKIKSLIYLRYFYILFLSLKILENI